MMKSVFLLLLLTISSGLVQAVELANNNNPLDAPLSSQQMLQNQMQNQQAEQQTSLQQQLLLQNYQQQQTLNSNRNDAEQRVQSSRP